MLFENDIGDEVLIEPEHLFEATAIFSFASATTWLALLSVVVCCGSCWRLHRQLFGDFLTIPDLIRGFYHLAGYRWRTRTRTATKTSLCLSETHSQLVSLPPFPVEPCTNEKDQHTVFTSVDRPIEEILQVTIAQASNQLLFADPSSKARVTNEQQIATWLHTLLHEFLILSDENEERHVLQRIRAPTSSCPHRYVFQHHRTFFEDLFGAWIHLDVLLTSTPLRTWKTYLDEEGSLARPHGSHFASSHRFLPLPSAPYYVVSPRMLGLVLRLHPCVGFLFYATFPVRATMLTIDLLGMGSIQTSHKFFRKPYRVRRCDDRVRFVMFVEDRIDVH